MKVLLGCHSEVVNENHELQDFLRAAQLAGVSVDYYSRLEQGRTNQVSTAVLTAVARPCG